MSKLYTVISFKNSITANIFRIWFIILCLLTTIAFENINLQFTFGLFFLFLSIYRIGTRSTLEVPLTSLMLFNNMLQLFLAAFILYLCRSSTNYDIPFMRYQPYFSFAVPACIALYLGVFLSEIKFNRAKQKVNNKKLDLPLWAIYRKNLFFIGLFFVFSRYFFNYLQGLDFFILLLACLRYVGLFAIILNDDKGWMKYAIFIFILELIIAIGVGLFNEFIIWFGSFLLILSYKYEWKNKIIFVLLLAFVFSIFLQSIKKDYRAFSWSNDRTITQKSEYFFEVIHVSAVRLVTSFNLEDLTSSLTRFNQGRIVDLVMSHVPQQVPYAAGETFIDALYAVFAPRVLFPDKPISGGKQNYEKYTGRTLNEGTSMTIGVIGEMYANFGKLGGIAGFGFFGYLIGYMYSFLRRKAFEDPVWWAWGPFLGFWAIKGEAEFSGIMNWIVKGLLVMIMVIFITSKAANRKAPTVNV